MIKHVALFLLLAGLMSGCQSAVAPVEEAIEETETTEKVTEEKSVAEETAKTEVEEKAEAVTEETKEVVETEEPVKEEKAVVAEEKKAVAPSGQPLLATALIQPTQKEEKRNTIMILMKTSKGDIKIELDADKAPKTVANFMKYVESGHYTDVIFHRVISNFMIQGGGFDENMRQKPAPHTVENEAKNGLKNDEGTIAMARTNDPHSGGAQFFINVGNNSFLNYPGQDGWGYAVFGKVVDGMDVVNEIKNVPTGRSGPHGDVPKEPVFIKEVVVIDE